MKPESKGMRSMREEDSSFNLSSLKEAKDSTKKSTSDPLDLSSFVACFVLGLTTNEASRT